MKHIILFFGLVFTSQLNAQTKFEMTSNTESVMRISPETDFEFVQKILSEKPIHIHPDSTTKGFLICWSGPVSEYIIYSPNGKIKKQGKITTNQFVSTKRWKGGKYILKIDDNIEILMLMRN